MNLFTSADFRPRLLTRPGGQMRLLAWNIRAGGGHRIGSIFQQIMRWQPDVLALSEFRGTESSRWLATSLKQAGYVHQRQPPRIGGVSQNGVFIASAYPLRIINQAAAPREANRWLQVSVHAPKPLVVGAMHVPNQFTGRKPAFHESILALAQRRRYGRAIFLGDTNSGKIDIDEENPVFNKRTNQWFDDMAGVGWRDAFRHIHGDTREYTWYSPNHNNGFRLDQAFTSPKLTNDLVDAKHIWGSDDELQRRDALSDHAALILDIAA